MIRMYRWLLLPCLAALPAIAWSASGDGSAWLEQLRTWLMTPISGSSHHFVPTGTAFHGRLMVIAWGVFVPVGIVLSRFYKVTPAQDWPRVLNNPFWFNSHRAFEYGAGALTLAAAALVLLDNEGRAPWRSFHVAAGWSIVIVGWLQLLGSHLRGVMGGPSNPVTRVPLRNWQWRDVAVMGEPTEPFAAQSRFPERWHGAHFSMTRQRIVFEILHKGFGYVLLGFSALTLVTGLIAADALNWMWVGLALWWLACLAVFVVFQRQGRCIDCYQAIWGVDGHLPGNRAQPIGWGIRRYTLETVARAPYPRRRKAALRD
jgi:hypothetical protein